MKLSQNFLIDPVVITRLCDALAPCDQVIEIGPGKGAITKELLRRGKKVVAVELDRVLAKALPSHPHLRVYYADALTFQYPPIPTLIANLPFHIATPLILRLIQLPFKTLIVIVQDEVAKRLTASAGTKAYGALTLNTQLFARTRYLFSIPPTCFSPRPKVTSAAIEILPHPKSALIDIDFLYKAFRQRRKMIKSALKQEYPQIHEALKAAKIDPNARAETLTLEQFFALWQQCEKDHN